MVLTETVGINTCNILHDMENAFYDRFCLNAWILFGDEGSENKKTHHFRLVDLNACLTNQIIIFAEKLLETTGKDPKALLNLALLKLADINPGDLKNDRDVLKKYRNQFGAHSDDCFPQTPSEQLYYPKLINLTSARHKEAVVQR